MAAEAPPGRSDDGALAERSVGGGPTAASVGTAPARRTFCRFCIAGCGLLVTTDGHHVTTVRGDPAHPVTRGYTCSKGRAIASVEEHPRRLRVPEWRNGRAAQELSPDALAADVAARLDAVISEHGPAAAAVYLGTGAGFDAAAWAVGARFAKRLGMRRYTSLTLDAVAKPYVAELMAGRPSLVGHPDPEAEMVLVVGTNPVVSHGHTTAMANPVAALRRWARQGSVWVLDPRRTETAALATRHVACRPGTDDIFLAHVLSLVLRKTDLATLRGRADGVDELADALAVVDRHTVQSVCDVDPVLADELAASALASRAVAVLSGTGSTMGPAANVTEWLLQCFTVVTDSAERPGGTWFHPGYFTEQRSRAPSPRRSGGGAGAGGVPPSRWGQFPSASLVGEIESGRIRALVVVGGNPLSACPGSGAAAEALSGLPLLAVADVVEGPLTAMATHTMPCASQLERADLNLTTELAQPLVVGQYTPALRRRGPGVRSAWWWLAAVAHHLGRPLLPDGLDLDAGDDAVLDLVGGARAAECRARPVEHRDAAPLRRPWVHDALPGGRWQLAPAELLQEWRGRTAAVAGPGLVLVPHRERGRINSAVVAGDAPACLALHPVDAGPAHIEDGDWVEVTSSSGRLTTRARLDPRLRPGAVMVPHGHTGVPVNELTTAASMNPRTGMPVYAAVAVSVRRTTAPRG